MYIEVHLPEQKLTAFGKNGDILMETKVSTARNGPGEQMNSLKTPRGWHSIRAKIGADSPMNSVFVGRRFTGEIYSDSLGSQNPDRDWILTRIMWLNGLEAGFNRLGNVDTMRRYIYIHGCPDSDPMGEVGSSGCIKMRNEEIVKLFDIVEVGTLVYVNEGKSE